MKIAVLHPGEMGAAVAEALGEHVIWDPEGRSAATAERARNLTPGNPLEADVILSICPPHAARDVARSVRPSPASTWTPTPFARHERARSAGIVAGADFVDGGIIGPPPVSAGSTRLYLSGDKPGGRRPVRRHDPRRPRRRRTPAR